MNLQYLTFPLKHSPATGDITDFDGAFVAKSAQLGFEISQVLNAHFAKKEEPVKEQAPTPNQKETDAVAVKYYESGRTLEVEFYEEWSNIWKRIEKPGFLSTVCYRIKPSKRRVVVDVYKSEDPCPILVLRGFEATIDQRWKLLGTIEGEVEG